MKYRPEIDGLRAIAVLAVMFYHAQFTYQHAELFPGGFLGVDIFFVISGYLITTILWREMEEGRFSFIKFYERRARRILPALFVVILFAIPFGWIRMLNTPFIGLGESMISTMLFSSNFLFWSQSGYWDAANELKPLLHTWSLAVEEQYYLLFPVVMLLLFRFMKHKIIQVFGVLFLLSFALAAWMSQAYPSASFYLLPARGWELLAGSLLAGWEHQGKREQSGKLDAWLALLGLCMILASIFWMNDSFPHPSFGTLTPVIGTMLVIWFSKKGGFVTTLLSLKPIVAIGLISYSLYLWHQPVFAFTRMAVVLEITNKYKRELIVMTFMLAGLSWWLVERPFRKPGKVSAKTLWIFSLSGCLLITGFGASVILKDGFPERWPPLLMKAYYVEKGKEAQTKKVQRSLSPVRKDCDNTIPEKACLFGDKNAVTQLVLLGDSHMGVLAAQFHETVSRKKWSMLTLTHGGCMYAPAMEIHVNGQLHSCSLQLNLNRKKFLLNTDKKYVVVAGGRLPAHLSGYWFNNQEGGIEKGVQKGRYFLAPPGEELPEEERKKVVSQVIIKETEALLQKGHKVVLVYPVPEVGWYVTRILSQVYPKAESDRAAWLAKGGLSTSYQVFLERVKEAHAVYDAIEDHPNLMRIHPEKYFCNGPVPGRCITHTADKLYYRDDNHLSPEGNQLLVDEFLQRAAKDWDL